MSLSNDTINGHCTSFDAIYFGKHKIYIYKVENENTLKRWLVTPEGESINPVVVAKTEEVYYLFLLK